jgi:ribosomal-protein-alanine N-acetyltransferase
VAGYIGSQTVLGWADMMNLCVNPDFRRQGIGEKLTLELERQLREEKVECLTLEVRVSNAPAITLYEKLGFKQVGKRPRYYEKPREDALILRKEFN